MPEPFILALSNLHDLAAQGQNELANLNREGKDDPVFEYAFTQLKAIVASIDDEARQLRAYLGRIDDLQARQKQLVQFEADARGRLAQLEQQSQTTYAGIQDAEKQAKNMRDAAQADIDKAKTAAGQEIAAMRDKANADIAANKAASDAKLKEVSAQIDDHMKQLVNLNVAVTAAQNTWNDLKDRAKAFANA